MVLSEEARAKSAFVGPLEKYEITQCPFALAQAPAYFQQLIYIVMRGLDFDFVYLDGIHIFSPDPATHLKLPKILYDILRGAELKIKDCKCNFLEAHVQYLGHLISGRDIEPVPKKLESIRELSSPGKKEVNPFL